MRVVGRRSHHTQTQLIHPPGRCLPRAQGHSPAPPPAVACPSDAEVGFEQRQNAGTTNPATSVQKTMYEEREAKPRTRIHSQESTD